ncbi:MAG TPA: NAD(P)H-dependent oxidoreductase [Ktedonobacteraceae bacterium]|nr:NAD(P)H-dependent oxidoreductase [Ktedonobacteraceae bacterium]
MKTLIVKYLPNKRSRTRKLLEAFLEGVSDSEIEELDLCKDVPDLFSPEVLEGYFGRIIGAIPRGTPVPSLAKMDRMTTQLKSADIVVLATPIYNFSLPATVKAWFDSVMLQGETFKPNPKGAFLGLMTGKKALALMTAFGTYSIGDGTVGSLFGPTYEHGMTLAKLEFKFMGFSDIRGVLGEGMSPSKTEEAKALLLDDAIELTRAISQEWYAREVLTKNLEPV